MMKVTGLRPRRIPSITGLYHGSVPNNNEKNNGVPLATVYQSELVRRVTPETLLKESN
jgi:hypothetical protein